MTLVGTEFLKIQETKRANRASEALKDKDIITRKETADADRFSRETVSALDRTSKEKIASADRRSREQIASEDRASRENVSSLDRASKESIAVADRNLKREQATAKILSDYYVPELALTIADEGGLDTALSDPEITNAYIPKMQENAQYIMHQGLLTKLIGSIGK